MKRLLTWAGSFLLIAAVVFCALGAVISAYDFPVDMRMLLFVLAAEAALLSALATAFRGKGILPCLIPALIALYYRFSDIAAGCKWVLYSITNEYNKWFSMPVLFRGAEAAPGDVFLFFAAVGTALAFLLAVSVCLWHSASFTFYFTAPVALLSIVVVEFSPSPGYLVGLLAVYLTMMLSSALHPGDFQKKGRAVFPALIAVGILLGAAYIAAPPDGYRRSDLAATLDDRIENFVREGSFSPERFGLGWPQISSGEWRFNTERVSVADAGQRTMTGQVLLEVTSSQAGTFYLRGYSMQSFDGRSWTGNSSPSGEFELPSVYPALVVEDYGLRIDPAEVPQLGHMTVTKTGDGTDVSYIPYYLYNHAGSGDTSEIDFYHAESRVVGFANTLKLLSSAHEYEYIISSYNEQIQSAYTQIDAATAEGLRELANQAGIDTSLSRAQIADQVAAYVSAAARYTLSPASIPENEDFAVYFLKTSRQGYCIHFATAATLMLRALDIPARFTTGYVATIPADKVGQVVDIQDSRAHAWVEVYYDDLGWVPLEVTPAGTGLGVAGGNAHSDGVETDTPAPNSETTPEPPRPEETPGRPGDGNKPEEGKPKAEEGLGVGGVLLMLLCLAAVLGSAIVRPRFLSKRRERDFTQADTNTAAICAWRYITRLQGEKGVPPDKIEELALKARYSRHKLTEEERAAVTGYASALAEETYSNSNPLGKLWLRYIRGLY